MSYFRIAGQCVASFCVVFVSGCGIFDAYQREHHLKNDESTALILDAKQRVIIQREVKPDDNYDGRIKPGVITCAEPSPDVAQALSTALSTSLAAGLPSASGARNFSADISHSSAESIVQLGSRIATIQLLRDELADLCRSYANGAVTGTTYTLRLSRLDKKMVTLLLSEAAGRPASTQAFIVGNAEAKNQSSASPEEVQKARQAVVDAAKTLSEKEEALKSATTDADKTTKQAERDAAMKVLRDRNAELLTIERRALETSTDAKLQTVLFNAAADGAAPSDSLVAIQDNFLMQDDLSTFLDACISSLDLLQKPASDAEEKALTGYREQILEAAKALDAAQAKKDFIANQLLSPAFDSQKQATLQEELNEASRQARLAESGMMAAKQRYEDGLAKIRPISRFGEYCKESGLALLINANVNRIEMRNRIFQERRATAEVEARLASLEACTTAIKKGVTLSTEAMQACSTAIAGSANEIRSVTPAPREARASTVVN